MYWTIECQRRNDVGSIQRDVLTTPIEFELDVIQTFLTNF